MWTVLWAPRDVEANLYSSPLQQSFHWKMCRDWVRVCVVENWLPHRCKSWKLSLWHLLFLITVSPHERQDVFHRQLDYLLNSVFRLTKLKNTHKIPKLLIPGLLRWDSTDHHLDYLLIWPITKQVCPCYGVIRIRKEVVTINSYRTYDCTCIYIYICVCVCVFIAVVFKELVLDNVYCVKV